MDEGCYFEEHLVESISLDAFRNLYISHSQVHLSFY